MAEPSVTRSDVAEQSGERPTRRQADLLDRLQALFLARGFAHFTLDDLAAELRCSKSTLYALAPSKEQLAVRVVAHYFKNSAATIEERVRHIDDPRRRMGDYLAGAAEQLRPASRRFIADMAQFQPTREIYEANARAAAERVRGYVREGVESGVFRDVHASLVAEMVGLAIGAIQRGDLGERTGLSDAAAFAELSQFVLAGLAPDEGARPSIDKTGEPEEKQ